MIAAPNYHGPTDIPGAKPIKLKVQQLCEWTSNDDGFYDTACGHAHEFITDGPKENGYSFCPYCGKTLIETHQEPTP